MTYQLTSPVIITSRLLPGVLIGEAEVSIGYAKRPGRDGRTRYEYWIDTESSHYHNSDLQSGCQGGTLQEGLESLLDFLSACAESYRHKMRNPDSEPENLDLFPERIAEWAYTWSDEIGMLAVELREKKLIEE